MRLAFGVSVCLTYPCLHYAARRSLDQLFFRSKEGDTPLMEAGVDSLGAVELRNLLRVAAGASVALPSTVVFDHPTARQLAAIAAHGDRTERLQKLTLPTVVIHGDKDPLIPIASGEATPQVAP